ncbi:MAG: 1-deoxy-D-xylulose-5-phosphate reductoisomerase, partial [Betaproteobacteria bacterium]
MTVIRHLTILGSTGSVGVSTLDVVARHPDRFHVTALTANNNIDRMLEQCCRFNPRYAVMLDTAGAEELKKKICATE